AIQRQHWSQTNAASNEASIPENTGQYQLLQPSNQSAYYQTTGAGYNQQQAYGNVQYSQQMDQNNLYAAQQSSNDWGNWGWGDDDNSNAPATGSTQPQILSNQMMIADSFTATDESWNWTSLDSTQQKSVDDNCKQQAQPLFPTIGDLKSKCEVGNRKKLETPQWSTESQPSLESSDDVLQTSESDKSHLMSRSSTISHSPISGQELLPSILQLPSQPEEFGATNQQQLENKENLKQVVPENKRVNSTPPLPISGNAPPLLLPPQGPSDASRNPYKRTVGLPHQNAASFKSEIKQPTPIPTFNQPVNLETIPDNSEHPDQPLVTGKSNPNWPQTDNNEAPINDRNQYLETGQLSEMNSADIQEAVDPGNDTLPPPGLQRMIPGQLEQKEIGGRADQLPGFSRMVLGQNGNASNISNQVTPRFDLRQGPPEGLHRMVPGESSSPETSLRRQNVEENESERELVHEVQPPRSATIGADTPPIQTQMILSPLSVSPNLVVDHPDLPQGPLPNESKLMKSVKLANEKIDQSESRRETTDGEVAGLTRAVRNLTVGENLTDGTSNNSQPELSPRRQSRQESSESESDRKNARSHRDRRSAEKLKSRDKDRERYKERDIDRDRYMRQSFYSQSNYYGQSHSISGHYGLDDTSNTFNRVLDQTDTSLACEDQPSAIQRLTPTKFSTAHLKASIASGNLIKILPHYPMDGQSAVVHVSSLRTLVESDPNYMELSCFPGPLSKGVTHKKQIIEYCESKIKGAYSRNIIDIESYVLLWELLILLIRQNGMVVGTDIAELLLKDRVGGLAPRPASALSTSSSNVLEKNEISAVVNQPASENGSTQSVLKEEEVTRRFREYLLYGSCQEALGLVDSVCTLADRLKFYDPVGDIEDESSFGDALDTSRPDNSWLKDLRAVLNDNQPSKPKEDEHPDFHLTQHPLEQPNFDQSHDVWQQEQQQYDQQQQQQFDQQQRHYKESSVWSTELQSHSNQGYQVHDKQQLQNVQHSYQDQSKFWAGQAAQAWVDPTAAYGQETNHSDQVTQPDQLSFFATSNNKAELKVEKEAAEVSTTSTQCAAFALPSTAISLRKRSVLKRDSHSPNPTSLSISSNLLLHDEMLEMQPLKLEKCRLSTPPLLNDITGLGSYKDSSDSENEVLFCRKGKSVSEEKLLLLKNDSVKLASSDNYSTFDLKTSRHKLIKFKSLDIPEFKNTTVKYVDRQSKVSISAEGFNADSLPNAVDVWARKHSKGVFNNIKNSLFHKSDRVPEKVVYKKTLVFGGTYPIDVPIGPRGLPQLQTSLPNQAKDKVAYDQEPLAHEKHTSLSKASSKSANQTTGWFGGIFSKLSMKPKNQMKLPDDKNPKIVWDENKKRWTNVDADPNETANEFKPPPKMLQFQSVGGSGMDSASTSSLGFSSVDRASFTPSGPTSLPVLGAAVKEDVPTSNPSLSNMFKMQKRRNLKNSYVDVFKQNEAKTNKEQAPLVALEQVPLVAPTQINFFVPQAISDANAPVDFLTPGGVLAPIGDQQNK
ncbi:hypothetical protein YQE_11040, partial [Dendroctonus ponderosae]